MVTLTTVQIRARAELELRKRDAERNRNYSLRNAHYQTNPFDYLVERLDYKSESIDWTLLPAYRTHIWDGTPNPLMEILDCLARGERNIGAESGTGTGKTFIGAGIVYWFLECFKNSLVVTTAPKEPQLQLHIWKEIGKLHNKFGRGTLTTLKLRMNEMQDDWIAVGFVAGVGAAEDSATKAQGFHAEHMLIIIEETPGVNSAVITALQNTSVAPHNIILAFGNPDHQLDTLHKYCTTPGTKHIRISCLDHPNYVTNNASFIPGATSREGVTSMLNRYGEENPFYLSRVRGLSPGQSADSLIQLKWCIDARDAKDRDKEKLIDGPAALGVDVANSEAGDKAAIARGKGAVLLGVKDFQCPNSNQLGSRDVLTQMKEDKVRDEYVGIDSVGVGAGTVNALKDLNHKVVALGGGDSPIFIKGQEEKFNNLRSQMHWQMREDLRLGKVILPNDEELFADLVTPKWSIQSGKICVEKKEDIKKHLGHSPNKGDAAIYWNWIRQGFYKPALGTASIL